MNEGFTKFPNYLLAALYKNKKLDRKMRLLILVMRKTYGFQKTEDWISLSQIQEELGLNGRANARKIVKDLINLGILEQSKNGMRKNILSINTNFYDWMGLNEEEIEDISIGKDCYRIRQRELSRKNTTIEIPTTEKLNKNSSNELLASPGIRSADELNLFRRFDSSD